MIRLFFTGFLSLFFLFAPPVSAQEVPIDGVETYMSREVVGRIASKKDGEFGQEVLSVQGEDGAVYEVDPTQGGMETVLPSLNVGDRVILSVIDNLDGSESVYFVDVVRTNSLWVIAVIFAVLTVAVGLRRGLMALIGFAATLAILFLIVFPRILGGADPVLTVMLAGILILAVNLFLAHGVTRNTTVAFVSTSFGVVLAWAFSSLFIVIGNLTGLADEQSMYLYWNSGMAFAPSSLLLAGIMLGTIGVLDDVAITQAETVAELRAANADFDRKELFLRAMRVGRHHIASTVNTLVLAYAGSALPLFLIFLSDDGVSAWRFLNTEMVAQEIVRTLAGTTALILVVPIATFLAAWVWSRTAVKTAKIVLHEEQS